MGRRSQGEDSIYRRKKGGLWAARYLVDTPEGKTKRKYVYGKMRKDVAEKLAEALKGRGEGLLLDAGSLTVAEFLADCMDSEKESLRESTQARREQVLRLHVYPNIGHLRLGKLNGVSVHPVGEKQRPRARPKLRPRSCCVEGDGSPSRPSGRQRLGRIVD